VDKDLYKYENIRFFCGNTGYISKDDRKREY